jgi:hypothetical protein
MIFTPPTEQAAGFPVGVCVSSIWEIDMATVTTTGIEEAELSTFSWGAAIAGAVASAALTLFLLALGIGLGLSVVSPWGDQGVSTTTFSIGAGLYLVAVAMLASTVGGYLAGRLRIKWAAVNEHEIYFRDTAHGLVVWALATLISASALGAAGTHLVSGLSAGLAPAAANVAAVDPTDTYVDTLLRSEPTPANAAAAGAAGTGNAATRNQLKRLMVPMLRKGGDLAPADRVYVSKVVAARTGLSQADAEQRVNTVVTQAKQAADDARKATAKFALWLAASMLAGAVAAMLGATEGGLLRDSKWYEPGWRTTIVRTH